MSRAVSDVPPRLQERRRSHRAHTLLDSIVDVSSRDVDLAPCEKSFQHTAHDLGILRQCSGCKPTDQSCVVCDEFGCTSCAHDTLCTKCVIDADRSELFMMAPQLGGIPCWACLVFFCPSGARRQPQRSWSPFFRHFCQLCFQP